MSRLRSSLASSKPRPNTTVAAPASPPPGDDAGQPPIDADGNPPSRRPKPSKPSEPPPRPQLAMRSDFTLLLAVDDLSKHDLTGRTFWTCIELTQEEAQFARERGVNAEQEIAAKLISRIPKRRDPDDN